MKSFFFWFIGAMAIGALIGSILRPGIPEILIAAGGLYGLLQLAKNLRSRTTATKAV